MDDGRGKAPIDAGASCDEVEPRRLFDQVSADRMRVTGYHFPFPATGFVVKEGNGYRFVPADWNSGV